MLYPYSLEKYRFGEGVEVGVWVAVGTGVCVGCGVWVAEGTGV